MRRRSSWVYVGTEGAPGFLNGCRNVGCPDRYHRGPWHRLCIWWAAKTTVSRVHTAAFVWLMLLVGALPIEIILYGTSHVGWLLPATDAACIPATALCCWTLGGLDC